MATYWFTANKSGHSFVSSTTETTEHTLTPGEKFETDDACEMIQFLNNWSADDGDTSWNEQNQGTVEQIYRACNPSMNPEANPDAGEVIDVVAEPPDDGDDADQQGAPSVDSTGQMSMEPSPDDLVSREPTDAVFDQTDPESPDDVADAQAPGDATAEDVESLKSRWLRNQPDPGQRDPSHSGEASRLPTSGGDPVDLFSGQLTITRTDMVVPAPILPLALVRRYRSGRPYFGPWGYGWDHNYNVYLRELADGGVVRWTGELHEDYFRWTGNAFEPERGVHDRLERESGQPQVYRVTRAGGTTLRFERPPLWTDAERIPLVEIRDRHGNVQTLDYDTENRVQRVHDEDGRALNFRYGMCGLLERLEDHTGRQVRYDHHAHIEHLIRVVAPPTESYPDGASTCYEYDSSADHPAMRHNLVRIVDADGMTYLQNEYGGPDQGWKFNRVVAQLYGDHPYEYQYEQVQFVPSDPVFIEFAALRAMVRPPDGSLHSYTFNYRGDLLDYRFRLNLDGSYRVVASQWRYDEQGNVTAEVRPDGSRTEYTYDSDSPNPCARGNLLKIERFATGLVTSRVVFEALYDPDYQLPTELLDEAHAHTKLHYDFDVTPAPSATGRLVRIEWPTVTLPDQTMQTAVTDVETNERAQLTALVSPEGSRREFRYHDPGTVLGAARLGGFLFEEQADVGGLAVRTTYEYDDRGFSARQHDAVGTGAESATELRFNANGELEERILPPVDGIVDTFRFRYGPHGQLRSIERPRGEYADGVIDEPWICDEFHSDPIGHVVQSVGGANTARPRIRHFCPDFEGRPVEEIDPRGTVTRRRFDERGLLLSEILAAGTRRALETRFVYDRAGRLVRRIAPGDRVTKLEYDPWGRPFAMTLPSGTIVRFEWGPRDLLRSCTVEGDPGDGGPTRVLERTTFDYDERGRLVRTTMAGFATDVDQSTSLPVVHWYDRDDRCVKREGVRGATWTYEYDALGRQTRVQDPAANAVGTEYDARGLPTSVSTENLEGDVTRVRTVGLEHDARSRLVRRTTPAGVSTVRYDARNLAVETTNERGVVSRNEFGLLDELTRMILDVGALALVYEQAGDPLGRPELVRDPTHEETSFERDALGRIVRVTLADASEWQYTYNSSGDLERLVAPGGSVITLFYDDAGRVSALTSVPGPGRVAVPSHAYTYDGVDRLVSATAGGISVMTAFDGLGRLRVETAGGRTFERVFDDLAGNSILLFPDGRQEEHTWDLLGRVERIRLVAPGASAVGGNGTPGSLIAETAYSGPAQAWWIRQGNGVVSQWHYDDAARLIRVDHRGPTDLVLESARYRHDAASRRRVSQLLATPARTVVHQFDAASRLTDARWGFGFPPLADADTQPSQEADIAAADGAAAGATEAEVSQLDASDTRLSTSTTTGAATTNVPYVSLSGHRIVSAGAEVIGYDADGNRTHDAARLFTYDALGRCVAVRDAATQNVIAEIVYDPLGRISGGDRGFGPFRRYFFGSAWLQEEDGAATVTRQRTVHSTLSLALTESLVQGAYYRHEDGHRDLVLVTGADGAPAERYRYSPFGVATVLDASGSVSLPSSALGLEPTFGGMAHWSGPQLFSTPRRLYDARLGIFTSRDPELYTTSPSPYVFARHDPVNFIDPAGDTPAHVVAGLVVGAVGLVAGVAGTYLAKPDADFWDYAAAGGIGFGAGFLAGATFGAAASGASSLLLNAGLGAAKVGNVAVGHAAVPVLSGVMGGAATSGTAGLASGAAMGLYQGYRHGPPGSDPWEMAASGAGQEAFAGAVAGAVGGGMFGGLLRAGALPRGALRSIARGGSLTPVVWARSIASPYGLGAAAIGYQSSVSGSVARQWIRGEDIDPFSPDVQRDALLGLAVAQAVPLVSSRSRAYWIIRRDPVGASEVLRRHGSESSGRHHMRSVASYPELAVDPKNLRPYVTEEQHAQWHREWDIFPEDPSWRSTQTHGPYTQSWPAPFGFRVPRPSAGGKQEKP